MVQVGGGGWSIDAYTGSTAAKISKGTTFAYSNSIHSGSIAAAVHVSLDPKKVAGATSPLAGSIVRESRDSDEHPNSIPIIVAFDETGSMGAVPRMLQKKLAELFALLLRKGYVEDPQLCVGAYGDLENHETAPVQIGQFESDNRADETLDNLYLEGAGGGNGHESAAAIWMYAANYTATDHWDKRGAKGYIFTIGDETTGGISRTNWKHYVDKDCALEADLTPKQVVELAQEKWNVFHVLINNTSAHRQNSLKHYTDLLGTNNVLVLQDENAVCEVIAVAIGMTEGTVDLAGAMVDLDDVGAGNSKVAVGKALAGFSGSVKGRSSVVVADGPGDLVSAAEPATTRL